MCTGVLVAEQLQQAVDAAERDEDGVELGRRRHHVKLLDRVVQQHLRLEEPARVKTTDDVKIRGQIG